MAQNVVGAFNVRAGLDSTQFRTGCKDINNAIGQSAAAVASSATKMMTPLKGVNKHIEDSRRTFRSFQRDAKQVFESTRTSSERYAAQVAKLSNLHKRGFLDAQTYARGIAQARAVSMGVGAGAGRLAGLGATAGMVGMAAGIPVTPYLAVGAAIGGVGKAAHTAETFTRAMNQSLAIAGDVSAKTRREMEQLAFTIARKTVFSAKEAAGAYYYLFSAGLDVERSMKTLPNVAKFAQAGMFDLATATSLLTDAQSALGMKVKDPIQNMKNMVTIADMLVKANTLADASVHEFAEALRGPLAGSLRAYNRELAEGVALLALMAERGVKGPEASQMGMIMYRDLPRALAANRPAFREFNIDIADAQENLLPMPEIIKNLTEGLEGLGDVERAAAMDAMGLTRSVRTITEKLLEGTGELHNFEAELRASAGTMDDVSDRQMTDFQKGWQDLGGAIAETSHRLGEVPMSKLGILMQRAATLMHPAVEALRSASGIITGGQIDFGRVEGALWEELDLDKAFGELTENIATALEGMVSPAEAAKKAVAGLNMEMAAPAGAIEDYARRLNTAGLAEAAKAAGALSDAFEHLDMTISAGAAGIEDYAKRLKVSEWERLVGLARSITERVNPAVALERQFADLQAMVSEGLITGGTARLALQDAAKRVSPKAKEIGAAPWIEAGTQAEVIREWEHRAGRGADPMKELVDKAQQQLDELIQIRERADEEANKEVKVLAAPP